MAYAMAEKNYANATSVKDAFIARVNGITTEKLRVLEKDFVMIPWHEWLAIKENTQKEVA